MAASDSYSLIVILTIAAPALAFAIGMWIRARSRCPIDQPNSDVMHVPPVPRTPERHSLWNALSKREAEIALLAAEDWTDEDIAHQLNLSVRTVQNHLQHARVKLRIHSRHEFKYYLQPLGDEPATTPK